MNTINSIIKDELLEISALKQDSMELKIHIDTKDIKIGDA